MSRHLSMRTANPALQSDTFRRSMSGSIASDGTMTINGVVNKTGLSLFLLIISASITWSNPALSWLGMVGTFAGLILAVVTIFKPKISHLTVPAYAIMQGLFLGLISRVFENQYPGIAVQAIFLTFGTLGSLLLAYMSGLIKATENFKLGIFAVLLLWITPIPVPTKLIIKLNTPARAVTIEPNDDLNNTIALIMPIMLTDE